MSHDVFISHSVKDKWISDAVCTALESDGIKCWIAPRDILPGQEWAEAIIDAITKSRIMVVIFSSSSNESKQVLREVSKAVSEGISIIPIRVEDITPTKAMEYYLSIPHWLDALTQPVEQHITKIVVSVKTLLEAGELNRQFKQPFKNPIPDLGQSKIEREPANNSKVVLPTPPRLNEKESVFSNKKAHQLKPNIGIISGILIMIIGIIIVIGVDGISHNVSYLLKHGGINVILLTGFCILIVANKNPWISLFLGILSALCMEWIEDLYLMNIMFNMETYFVTLSLGILIFILRILKLANDARWLRFSSIISIVGILFVFIPLYLMGVDIGVIISNIALGTFIMGFSTLFYIVVITIGEKDFCKWVPISLGYIFFGWIIFVTGVNGFNSNVVKFGIGVERYSNAWSIAMILLTSGVVMLITKSLSLFLNILSKIYKGRRT